MEHSAFVDGLLESVADGLDADRDKCAVWVMTDAEIFIEENRAKFEFKESSQSLLGRLIHVVVRLLRVVARCLPDPLFLGAK